MPFTFIQARAAVNVSTLAFTSNVTSGNLLVVVHGCESANPALLTVTDTVGTSYSLLDSNTGSSSKIAIFAGTAAGSGANTVTLTGSVGSFHGTTIGEWQDATLPKDVSANSYNGSSPSTVTFTTTVNNPLVVAAVHSFDSGNTFTAGSGYTMAAQANGADAIGMMYGDTGVAGLHSASMNVLTGSTSDCAMVAVAFPAVVVLALVAGNPATATLNFAYSQTLASAVNGTPPYTFEITSGSLPAGISMDTSALLTGVPTVTGDFPVTVKVTDSATPTPATASGPYIVHVAPNADIGPHDLTSFTSHPPFVVSASSNPSPGAQSWQLFAADGSTSWLTSSATGYVRLDVGTDWREAIVAYAIRATTGAFVGGAPKDWTVRGSNDLVAFTTLDTITGQTGWVDNEVRLFFVTGAAGWRYLELNVTATDTGIGLTFGKLSYYRPGPKTTAPIVGLTLVAWDAYSETTSLGVAEIFLGSPGFPPGSIFDPGGGIVYFSGTPFAFSQFNFAVDLLGDLTGPAIVITDTTADVTQTVVWFSIQGSTLGSSDSKFNVYGVYFRAYFADGTHRYAYPTIAQVESGSRPGVNDPLLAIDDSLDTFSQVFCNAFSPLSTASYLRISGFGDFAEAVAFCNNPPAGTVGQAYTHTLTATGVLDPLTWTLVSGTLPNGLALSSGGVISGTPVLSGTFPFTVSVTGQTFSDPIPNEADTTIEISCSITIAGSSPCPDVPGSGSQVGPG